MQTHAGSSSNGRAARVTSNRATVTVFVTVWPWPLTFWPLCQCIPSDCYRVYVTKFVVDSSCRIPFTARTYIQTDRQTDRQTRLNALPTPAAVPAWVITWQIFTNWLRIVRNNALWHGYRRLLWRHFTLSLIKNLILYSTLFAVDQYSSKIWIHERDRERERDVCVSFFLFC